MVDEHTSIGLLKTRIGAKFEVFEINMGVSSFVIQVSAATIQVAPEDFLTLRQAGVGANNVVRARSDKPLS